MNGVHDLGGMHGFGPVERSPDPPTLVRWESIVRAIQLDTRAAGVMNVDEFRHGIERMDPVHYLSSPYFEHWLDGISRVLVEKGRITEAELEARAANLVAGAEPPMAARAAFKSVTPAGFHRDVERAPQFQIGGRVRTSTAAPAGHTRMARYARGKLGTVHAWHGAYVFPDSSAHGLGDDPQHLYSVRFAAAALWGESAEAGTSVYIDLWEPYLQTA
jgi:nitrile hydratase